MAFLSLNMKKRPPATTVNDNTMLFGAAGGISDPLPEPFSVAVLWAFLAGKISALADPAGTAATLAAGAVLTANGYTDAQVADEAQARSDGDLAAVAAAAGYTNAAIEADNAGTVRVRNDITQPEVDCLWIAPDGRVVLITGSV